MKTIDKIGEDIYELLDSSTHHESDSELVAAYAKRIGGELDKATDERNKPREKGKLWASDLGKRCLRQHWYNFNMPEAGEGLTGSTKFKFLYGNILEEAVLYFAESAGHTVEEAQARVETQLDDWTISGRIDGIVDGVLIDVKSTSSFGYKRYKDGIDATNDSFGYLEQLGFYRAFNDLSPSSVDVGFIWIDKQNGHISYTKADVPDRAELELKARRIIYAVDQQEEDVAQFYSPQPYGKSGNMSLSMPCSYCPYKVRCWKDSNGGKGLRGFAYNHAPVWFTDVQREPRCPEITGDSNE